MLGESNRQSNSRSKNIKGMKHWLHPFFDLLGPASCSNAAYCVALGDGKEATKPASVRFSSATISRLIPLRISV